MNKLNKVILITGNRKGIGAELTDYFLGNGYKVVGCSRSPHSIENENYRHYICDVTDEKEVKGLLKFVRKEFGRIDILVNNAGMASLNHSLLTPGSTVDKVFKTNFNGTFFCSREAAKLMRKNKFGRIVNFSTVAVPLDLEGEMVYASSKAAIEKMTRIMSRELASNGITVNCIGPSPIETDLIKAVPKEKITELIDRQAIKRLGSFDDVKNVIEFFISDQSDFISGQTIYLGGV